MIIVLEGINQERSRKAKYVGDCGGRFSVAHRRSGCLKFSGLLDENYVLSAVELPLMPRNHSDTMWHSQKQNHRANYYNLYVHEGPSLNSDWPPDWNEFTPSDLIHQYDMVVIVGDYIEEEGVVVAPSVKEQIFLLDQDVSRLPTYSSLYEMNFCFLFWVTDILLAQKQ